MKWFKCWMLVVMAIVLTIVAGCSSGGKNWSVPQPRQTGVDPDDGVYNFVMAKTVEPSIIVRFLKTDFGGGRDNIQFQHSKIVNGQRYSNSHVIDIDKGGFFYIYGDIAPGTGSYPAEGFAISGSFVSPTQATGEIEFATYGYIIGKTTFIATLEAK